MYVFEIILLIIEENIPTLNHLSQTHLIMIVFFCNGSFKLHLTVKGHVQLINPSIPTINYYYNFTF